MSRRLMSLGLIASLTAGAALAAGFGSSGFLGAPSGTPLATTPVILPAVTAGPAALFVTPKAPFTPNFVELTSGETVITSDPQMRAVWRQLFSGPYDASLFDFQQDFVILMGGGQLSTGTFNITSVERVDAEWETFFQFPAVNPFLAVTGTTTLPGVAPPDPPPPSTYRVSAVRVSRSEFDDVVFNRDVIALP